MQLQKRNKNKAHNKVGSGNISGCRKTVSWPTIKYIFMPKLMYVCVCVTVCVPRWVVGGLMMLLICALEF